MESPGIIRIPIESFSYSRQSDVVKVLNEWFDDGRCLNCGYSDRSNPRLCVCTPSMKQAPRLGPVPPTRGTLPRKKDAVKAMVQQAFTLASGMSSLTQNSMDKSLPPANEYVGNGKPHQLSAQSSIQYTDDSQSMGSFFNDQQSSRMKNQTGLTEVYQSKWNKDSAKGKFFTFDLDPTCQTLYDVFRRGLRVSNGGHCFGWRPGPMRSYQWITYPEVLERAINFGSGLIAMGLRPGSQTLVGIYARNCVEWGIFEQAMYTFSMVLVPIYDHLNEDCKKFIMRETNMSVVVCGNDDAVNRILETAPRSVNVIVTIREIRKHTLEKAALMNIQVVKFVEVERFGSTNQAQEMPPCATNPAIICFNQSAFGDYNSGSPKGIMLSHENIISCACACIHQLDGYAPNKTDVMISYLPLAHMLERACQVGLLFNGGSIGFYSGDMRLFNDDIQLLKPTMIPAVPNVLNRMYDKVVKRMNSSNLRRVIFNMALKRKTKEIERGIYRNDSWWGRLLFGSVKRMVGGRCRLLIVGSAPLSGNILTFMRASLNCIVIEGYGTTECSGCCTLAVQGDSSTEHVGPPIACSAVKLCDVPELEYFASFGQGEICVRGTNVFLGYFKDMEKTRNVIDEEGWLHTGDIGQWLPNGSLKIIDRKKHVFKLSQGEYVVPEMIEDIYLRSPYVAQAFVHGDALKSCVVAIIVPKLEEIQNWAIQRKMPANSFTSLCNNYDVNRLLFNELIKYSQQAGLKHFEMVKDIYLHPDLFSYQNGLLNSMGKLKRKTVEKYFKPQLEDMYAKIQL